MPLNNPQKFEESLKERNLELVGSPPQNARSSFRCRCLTCGHEFPARFDVIQKSKLTGCSKCSMKAVGQEKRKSLDDYRELAKSKNLEFTLETAPELASLDTQWYCPECQKNVIVSYEHLRRRTFGCKLCGRRRLMQNVVDKIYIDYGFKIGRVFPQTTDESVWWTCIDNHPFKTCTQNINAGRACLKCGREKTSQHQRHKEADYIKLGEATNCIWVGPTLPQNVNTETNWKCLVCSYIFPRTYQELKSAGRCPECSSRASSERQKSTDAEYYEGAKKWGWEWLGPPVANQQELTSWRCPKPKHGKFEGRLKHVRVGSGCQECGYDRSSEVQRATAEQYHKLAKECRCTWIGKTVPKKASIKTQFKCWGANKENKVHKFERSYQKLLSDRALAQASNLSVCSRCAALRRQSRQQEAVFHLLKGMGRRYPEVVVGKWWVDIVLVRNGVKIAVEYDGWYRHKDRQEKDRIKRKALREAGYRTLRIKSGVMIPDKEKLHAAIEKLGEPSNQITWAEITLPDWGDR